MAHEFNSKICSNLDDLWDIPWYSYSLSNLHVYIYICIYYTKTLRCHDLNHHLFLQKKSSSFARLVLQRLSEHVRREGWSVPDSRPLQGESPSTAKGLDCHRTPARLDGPGWNPKKGSVKICDMYKEYLKNYTDYDPSIIHNYYIYIYL